MNLPKHLKDPASSLVTAYSVVR